MRLTGNCIGKMLFAVGYLCSATFFFYEHSRHPSGVFFVGGFWCAVFGLCLFLDGLFGLEINVEDVI